MASRTTAKLGVDLIIFIDISSLSRLSGPERNQVIQFFWWDFRLFGELKNGVFPGSKRLGPSGSQWQPFGN